MHPGRDHVPVANGSRKRGRHRALSPPQPRAAPTAAMLRAVYYAQLLFPDFSLILIGYLLCRHTALNRPVWQAVEALVYFFLFPVLLFQSIVRTPLDLGAASSLMGAGLALGSAGIALAYALPHLPWIGPRLPPRDHAAAAQVAFRFNSFIGLALAERLLGAQGLQLIAVLIGRCSTWAPSGPWRGMPTPAFCARSCATR